MAGSIVTRKFRIYRHLYHVNNAFQYLERNLEVLLSSELLERDGTDIWRNRLGELQAEINMTLTGRLHQQESGEVRRFGPMVEEWEERQISKASKLKRARKTKSRRRV